MADSDFDVKISRDISENMNITVCIQYIGPVNLVSSLKESSDPVIAFQENKRRGIFGTHDCSDTHEFSVAVTFKAHLCSR